MQRKRLELIIFFNVMGWSLGYLLFMLGCAPEKTDETVPTATTTATTWGTGTTTSWVTTGAVATPDPELQSQSGSTSDGGDSLESSSEEGATVDPEGCTDEAASHFVGCRWTAEIQNEADCTHCTEDPCTQIACYDACQRPLVQALDRCNATYPNCAELIADPLADCIELCRWEHTRCIYGIICETPTNPDLSPCDPPEIECNAACDRF